MKGAVDERYEQIKSDANLALKWKKVNRYTNLMNETLIKIGVRDGKIVYDIIIPSNCGVLTSDEDPTIPWVVWYQTATYNAQGIPQIEYYYYDLEGNAVILDDRLRVKADSLYARRHALPIHGGSAEGTDVPAVRCLPSSRAGRCFF